MLGNELRIMWAKGGLYQVNYIPLQQLLVCVWVTQKQGFRWSAKDNLWLVGSSLYTIHPDFLFFGQGLYVSLAALEPAM